MLKLTRREEGQLYIATVAAVTGRLMQGKAQREERIATAHEAHERGIAAIRKARESVGKRK